MATITVARSIHFTLSLHIKEGNKLSVLADIEINIVAQ
jgi:alpha-D-ribose 1-methylphosphonate 5-triphosphate synthase subunit PhnL